MSTSQNGAGDDDTTRAENTAVDSPPIVDGVGDVRSVFHDPILRRVYSKELTDAAEKYLINRFLELTLTDGDTSGSTVQAAMIIINGVSYFQPSETQIKHCLGLLGDARQSETAANSKGGNPTDD